MKKNVDLIIELLSEMSLFLNMKYYEAIFIVDNRQMLITIRDK
jgi:hypothetical protein